MLSVPAVLLAAYDSCVGAAPDDAAVARIPRELGKQLYALAPHYGASPAAIEQHVRRLLRDRKRQEADARRFPEAFKAATGRDVPNSLLTDPAPIDRK